MSTSNRRPKNPRSASAQSRGTSSSRHNNPKKKRNPKGKSNRPDARRGPRTDMGKPSGGAPRKYKKNSSSPQKEVLDPIPGNKEWGGLARKGVLRVYHDDQKELEINLEEQGLAESIELEPEELERQEERKRKKAERDSRQEELRLEARAALARAKTSPKTRKTTPPKPHKRKPITRGPRQYGELQPRFIRAYGHERGKKNLKLFHEAIRAYEDERFDDAGRKIKPLTKIDHKIAQIHELFGLILYRRGEYLQAAESLERFRSRASSTEQHPVLMDCYRAEKRWSDIEFLWEELREISPSGPLVVEGRIVMAGAFADRGNLKEAVRLLEAGWKAPKRPHDHHLRRAYALADLYDRAGNIPRSREIFAWIVKFMPEFVDANERLKNLR